ncbi:MAG: hypothetical protein K2P23_15105 [Lachnospiraceae bacterium]|nr:hypothetical protein [Lachnospiraceae bacterium]
MKKIKRFIASSLLFFCLACVEMGIGIEAWRQSWGGSGFAGNISLEYNEAGKIGISILWNMIPVTVIVMLLIRVILCIKKSRPVKELLIDIAGAICGIGLMIGMLEIIPDVFYANPILWIGKWITAFLFDTFDWMDYPIP